MLPFQDKKGNVSIIISKMMKDAKGDPQYEEKEVEETHDYEIAMERATEGLMKSLEAKDIAGALVALTDLHEMMHMKMDMEVEDNPGNDSEEY